jgi:hypothetical protein
MIGKDTAKPAMMEMRTRTKNCSCGAVKISSGLCPRATSTLMSGSWMKPRMGWATVKQATIATTKASTDRISRVRSSARCSISGAELSSIWSSALMIRPSRCVRPSVAGVVGSASAAPDAAGSG